MEHHSGAVYSGHGEAATRRDQAWLVQGSLVVAAAKSESERCVDTAYMWTIAVQTRRP